MNCLAALLPIGAVRPMGFARVARTPQFTWIPFQRLLFCYILVACTKVALATTKLGATFYRGGLLSLLKSVLINKSAYCGSCTIVSFRPADRPTHSAVAEHVNAACRLFGPPWQQLQHQVIQKWSSFCFMLGLI